LKRGRARSAGLTLLELAVALAVAAAVTVAALGTMRAVDRRTLDGASRMLASDLRYAQRMAIIEGRRWYVQFDVTYGRYLVRHQNPVTTVKMVELPPGVVIQNVTANQLTYLPRGTPSTGLGVWLSKGRFWQRTTVVPSGGRAQVKEMVVSADGREPVTEDEY
jgi:Tfp pilus assembly protein FimT